MWDLAERARPARRPTGQKEAASHSRGRNNTMTTCTTSSSGGGGGGGVDAVHRMQTVVEKLRLEIVTLKRALRAEKSAVRELKAQHEKDRRLHKTTLAQQEQRYKRQLKDCCNAERRTVRPSTKRDPTVACGDCKRHVCEIKGLKDANKSLEDKLEHVQEADRLKAADLRSQHESNLHERARVQRTARLETQKLLEELKTKDRLLDQLRRSLRYAPHLTTSIHRPLHTNESMRKLVKDVDRASKGCEGGELATSESVIDQTRPRFENSLDYYMMTMPPSEEIRGKSREALNNGAGPDEHQIKTMALEDRPKLNKPAPESSHHSAEGHQLSISQQFMDSVAEEDVDSAVSSAPSSLSPQPYHHATPHIPNFHTYPTSASNAYEPPILHKTVAPSRSSTITTNTPYTTFTVAAINSNFPPTSLSPQPSEDYTSPSPTNYSSSSVAYLSSPPPPDVWFRSPTTTECSFAQRENISQHLETDVMNKGDLQSELAIAKRQVRELERALLVTREVKSYHGSKHGDVIHMALTERIHALEARETALMAEVQELREHNELQEFRILELEECHENWSLRSQSSSELRDIESLRVTPLPLDMSDYKGDVVREHLITMSKKTTDHDDKHCLQQVLTLLDNLETLSQEHANCLEEISGDFYGKFIKSQPIPLKPAARIIATVLPFMECTPQSGAADLKQENEPLSLSPLKKKILSNASSLQESGIFEGDVSESVSAYTQTDFVSTYTNDIKLSELTAEIQKLNRIRESIEEGNKCPKKFAGKAAESRELDFYKNRLELLENKLNIYESSGDLQVQQLKKRLNNEILLDKQVKELTIKVDRLEEDNSRLDEERCELEEAENDTRLRCQQLEMEYELITERLRDVEEARSSNKRKAKETKALASYWETMATKYEERNYELEERETELQYKIDNLEGIIPVLIVFNIWKFVHDSSCSKKRILPIKDSPVRQELNHVQTELQLAITEKEAIANNIKLLEEKYKIMIEEYKEIRMKKCARCSGRKSPPRDLEYINRVQELLEANKELKKHVEQLEQREVAYIETLQQADNIWAEMEADYKIRIQAAEDNEAKLRLKVRQLEETEVKLRLADVPLTERIVELEDVEKKLEDRIHYYEKEHKYLSKENLQTKEELITVKSEWKNMRDHLEGPIHSEIERQRKHLRQLQDEIEVSTKVLEDTEDAHQKEITVLKLQLNKTNNELVHLDVTNSELKEEILQLQTRISELQTAILEQRINSDRTIKNLTSELSQRDRQCLFRKRSFTESMTLSLREELVQKSSPEPNDDGLNAVLHTST